MKKLLTLAALIVLTGSALAQDAGTIVKPDALMWKDNPNVPKGGQVALLAGDPTKAGSVVVQRVKIPPHYKVPPHTHPYAEVVTVISGHIGTNSGERVERNGGLLSPGALWVYPARHAHYAWTGPEEAVLQVQFTGPGGIDYVNPADDPRRRR